MKPFINEAFEKAITDYLNSKDKIHYANYFLKVKPYSMSTFIRIVNQIDIPKEREVLDNFVYYGKKEAMEVLRNVYTNPLIKDDKELINYRIKRNI